MGFEFVGKKSGAARWAGNGTDRRMAAADGDVRDAHDALVAAPKLQELLLGERDDVEAAVVVLGRLPNLIRCRVGGSDKSLKTLGNLSGLLSAVSASFRIPTMH